MKMHRQFGAFGSMTKASTIGFSLLLCFYVIVGCKSCELIPSDLPAKVTAALDKAIGSLNAANANWQQILGDAIAELPKEVQSTVANEVNNVLQRAISASGAEVRCDTDFFRNRVRQALQRIKAQYLGQTLPPLEPQLCNVIPIAVDMSLEANRRNRIEFYGYDFDSANVQVILQNGIQKINVSQYLDKPTHYHMTLNLGANGINLTQASTRLILRWNNRDISTIAVIQPQKPICQSKDFTFQPSSVSYMPPKTHGDSEFDGHGPVVFSSVLLSNNKTSISAFVYMKARETKSDWTTGEGTREYVIYNAPSGWEIESIVTPTYASYSYTDQNHATDIFPGSGPVRTFQLYGDTDGDDIGHYTRAEIDFNNITVNLKENSDCTSSNTLRMIQIQKFISPATLQRMQSMQHINFVQPMRFDSASIHH